MVSKIKFRKNYDKAVILQENVFDFIERNKLLHISYVKFVEKYLQKKLLSKNLKEIKIEYKKSHIDFYKSYKNTKTKLLRLQILTSPNTNFLTTITFLNFNLITYNGENSENFEYQKLKDIGDISYKIFKNKQKILDELTNIHNKFILKYKKLKEDRLRAIIKFENQSNKVIKSIISRMVYYLKHSKIDLTQHPKGSLPCIINPHLDNIPYASSIELIKNSKYKLKITTTDLNKTGNPIIWEIKIDNLELYLQNFLSNLNIKYSELDFLFEDE
jgi:hypothetical protein